MIVSFSQLFCLCYCVMLALSSHYKVIMLNDAEVYQIGIVFIRASVILMWQNYV